MTALKALKMTVFAPTPSASRVTAVKVGLLSDSRTASRRSWIKTLIVASAYFKGVEDSCARELQRDEEFPLLFRRRLRDRRPGPSAPLVVPELPPHFGAVVALGDARRHGHRRTGVRRVGDELLPGQLHDLGEGGGLGD